MRKTGGIAVQILGIGLGGCLLLSGCAEEWNGPEEFGFEGIDEVAVSLERGEVLLFGSESSEGARVHRWLSAPTGFSVQEERQSGRRLEVEGRCREGERCRARYDATLRRTARATLEVREGQVELVRMAGPMEILVEEGMVRGVNLESESLTVVLRKGEARLSFAKPPARLELRLEREALATVVLPDVRYRCDFDVESERIGLNGLQCHGMAERQILVDPPGGRVRFEVRSPAR